MRLGPVDLISPLGLTYWAVLAGIPVGIIALYFLKLRRRPVQVPSTLLWKRSLEDLHVNSLFQRLRKNLLLFLQLLAVLLVMLALAGPRIRGSSRLGERYVLAIDNSASMSATDVSPTRLEKAKAEAKKIINAMESTDLAMVVTFSDRAKVVSNYTGNRTLLNQRVDAIGPTEATTSLREALQVAAGLANPSKQAEGVPANSIVPPKLKIYTDGGFADVEGFSLGNLEPEVIVIGTALPSPDEKADAQVKAEARTKPPSNNVAILALQTRRNEEKPDVYQVFGRAHNFRAEDVTTEAKLYKLDPARPGSPGTLLDAIALKIGKQGDQSFNFDLPDTGAAELEVRIDVQDDLSLDNRAFTLIGAPRKAQILVVTAGNRYLVDTLRTPLAADRADVIIVSPEDYKTDAYKRDVAAGRFDLVIYDPGPPRSCSRVQRPLLRRPASRPGLRQAPDDREPGDPRRQRLAPFDAIHPRTLGGPGPQGNSRRPAARLDRPLRERLRPARLRRPPEWASPTPSSASPWSMGRLFNTDWVTKYSFPLFLFNTLQALGNARESAGEEVHGPGQPVVLRAESAPADHDDHRSPGQSTRQGLPDGAGDVPVQRGPCHRDLSRQVAAPGHPGVRCQPVRPPRERSRPPGTRPRRIDRGTGQRLQDQDRVTAQSPGPVGRSRPPTTGGSRSPSSP